MRQLCLILVLILVSPALGEGGGHLTLESVLQTVDSHHPKLRGARLLQGVARAKVTEKQGAFDPAAGFETAYQRYNSSSSPGKARDYTSLAGTVFRTDPSGVKWEAGWLNNQGAVKSPASSTGDVGEIYLEAKVPLLRGLNMNDKLVGLRQAELAAEQMDESYTRVRLLTLLEAGASYLNWVTATVATEVVEENLELAKVRAEQVKMSISAGDRPAIDQIEADREVQKRLEEVRKARRESAKHAFKLALYLWNSQGEAQEVPTEALAPDQLPQSQTKTFDVGEAQLRALKQRPELKVLKLESSIIDWDRRLAENEKLPQLDLALRPGYDVGGSGVGFTMKAGLQLVIPLATRTADGRSRAASLKLEKLDLEQVEMVRRILLQVQDAANELEASQQRLEASLEVYRLARELEEGERRKFEFGDSSLFLVNSRERSTLAAALKVLELRNEVAQAELLLQAVQGEL